MRFSEGIKVGGRGLHVGVVDSDGHIGNQRVFTLAAVPLVVGRCDALALVSIADAHILLPFHAIPLHSFAFGHAVLCVVAVVVLHVIAQHTVVRLVDNFSYFQSVHLFGVVDQIALVIGHGVNTAYHYENCEKNCFE